MFRILTILIVCFSLTHCKHPPTPTHNPYDPIAKEFLTKAGLTAYKRLIVGSGRTVQVFKEDAREVRATDFTIDHVSSLDPFGHKGTTQYEPDLRIDLGNQQSIALLAGSPLYGRFSELIFENKGRGFLDLRQMHFDERPMSKRQQRFKDMKAAHSLFKDPKYLETRFLLLSYTDFIKKGGNLVYESQRFTDLETLADETYDLIYQSFPGVKELGLGLINGRTFPPTDQVSTSFKIERCLHFYRSLFLDLNHKLTDIQVNIKSDKRKVPEIGKWYYLEIVATRH